MSERVLNSSRNSRARELTKGVISGGARKLHDVAPWLTPNQITLGGLIGVGAVAKYAEVANKTSKPEDTVVQRSVVGAAYTAICLSDGFDGALERHLQSIDPNRKGSQFGANFDAGSDRGQELALALSRISSAKDFLGKYLALGAAVTNSLPSLVRAYGESKGVVFEENGNDWLQFCGTRLGRAIIGGVSTLAPTFKEVPIQKTADALTIVSNISTATSRARKIMAHQGEAVLSEADQSSAKTRFKMLLGIEAAAVVSAVIAAKRANAA